MDKAINIMTSCDENLVAQLSILLQSIADNLPDWPVNFFLLYSRISRKKRDILKRQCLQYRNVSFHAVRVPDPQPYELLAKTGGWVDPASKGSGFWCGEAYYSLCAHRLLPPNLGRALYLDAGDTLVVGDIRDYYFADFKGKSLMVTGIKYVVEDDRPRLYEARDLTVPERLQWIVRGVFNSGSYVMNLDKMRSDNAQIQDFLQLAGQLVEISGDTTRAYLGDQGFLSAAYVGDMQYFGFPEIVSFSYMPYNFGMWYYDITKEKPDYQPRILHFAARGLPFKPWGGAYPTFLGRFQKETGLKELGQLPPELVEHYELWYRYAVRTEETLRLC